MPRLLWILAVFALGTYLSSPLFDPDLWWHITIGRWILSHHTVPFMEYWNSFAIGTPWIAYSWSNEALFALGERLGGSRGLVVLQLALGVFFSLSLFFYYGRIAQDYIIGSLIGTAVALGCITHFQLRPQTVAWLCFAGVLYGSLKVADEGYKRHHVSIIALSLIVWANSHITTILGIGTLVLVSAGNRRWLDDPIRHALFLLTMITCTFVTPYLGAEWGIFFGKADHPFLHSTIIEFGPATILHYAAGVCIVLMVLLATLTWQEKKAPPPVLLICAAIMTVGGFAVMKFMPFALLSLGFCLAKVLERCDKASSNQASLAEGIFRLRGLVQLMSGSGSAFFLLALTLVNVRTLWVNPLDQNRIPQAAVDFILHHRLPHPIANAFGEGGYLMYRLSDSSGDLHHSVSLDGRTNVNPLEVALLYQLAYQGRQGWERYIDLVQPKTVLWKNQSPLTALLLLSDKWCRVYKDGSTLTGYSVFLKKDELQTKQFEAPPEGC